MTRDLYSVWLPDERQYAYFTALDGAAPVTPTRRTIHPSLGDPPEMLLRGLPRRAFYLGRGPLARGEIVVRPRAPR